MTDRTQPAEPLPSDLMRLLGAYREGTSPTPAEQARLWGRIELAASVPAAATATVVLRVVCGFALVVGAGIAVRFARLSDGGATSVVDAPQVESSADARPTAHAHSQVEPPKAPSETATPPAIVNEPSRQAEPPRNVERSHAAGPPKPPPSVGPGLSEELAALERARVELGRGRPAEALVILAEHERAFPRGVLAQERRALRVVALCDAGKHAQGRGEARTLLAEHPASALAVRIRKACALAG